MIYQIIIYPIELILEITYELFRRVLKNPGLSIIGVSLAVQILTLPLYAIAEKWQKIERETQARLKPKVDKIKAVFKGDEQYMILSTYYKQNHYHPIFALRSTIGLLIQVPFFIAAYTFLSNLSSLQNVSFYIIPNLASPDALLKLGNFSVNLLPIIMTAINIVSAVVYTKGFSFREKAQLYGMALLFLVLLYQSPSALVLYWTLNNLFSLIKNLITKAKNPLKLFYILSSITLSVCALYYIFFIPNQSAIRKLVIVALTLFVCSIPFIVYIIRRISNFFFIPLTKNPSARNKLFVCAALSLFLLAGLFIPTSLIASSAQEFSFIDSYENPLQLLAFPLFQAAGFFIFWLPLLYILFSNKVKNILTWLTVSLLTITVFQTFLFIGGFGVISSSLQFETGIPKMPQIMDMFIDIAIIAFSFIAVLFIIKYVSSKLLTPILAIACLSFLFLSLYNVFTIQATFNSFKEHAETASTTTQTVYNLSKTEKNVIIIMLDRAISSFIPHLFDESPELKNQFTGFTYYPNTVSVNGHTLMGTPPLYGGYEYLPEEINKRNTESLVSKHNESLSVLPVLFLENGFNTTITDASWANYSFIPDNRVFSSWPDITAKNVIGSKTLQWTEEHNIDYIKQSDVLKRNFLFFSFFRMIPSSLRGALYDNGKWWEEQNINPDVKNYLNNFAALDYLAELTNVDAEKPSFNVVVNEATHNSLYLQYPEYKVTNTISEVGENIFGNEYIHKTYHVNMGSLMAVGRYFDFLRENNVYDNTRIIIVSDHGDTQHRFPMFENFTNSDIQVHPDGFHSLLMVKDFYTSDAVTTDTTFMTNADVPSLATKNLIENPKNPFTGTIFSQSAKQNGINVYVTPRFVPEQHNENTFILDGETWHVKDNIFEPTNWSKVQ